MTTVYKKVAFERNGVRRGILCEGPQGPSALVALYNILAIRHSSGYGREGPMDEEDVKDLIRGMLKIAFRKHAASGRSRSAAVSSKATRRRVSCAIDGLPTRLDVVPLPNGVLAFEVNDLYMLFSYLGIDLMHGWFWILERRHQLTAYGHSSLVAKVDDGDFAVVYCHNKFNVVHKHDGELFVLETDGEVRSRFPQVVCRLLDPEVQGDSASLFVWLMVGADLF
jgi:hypothetical protein